MIHASNTSVWQWLIQLGADRNGFYSYDFIEKVLGYKTRQQKSLQPEFKKIVVGDVVRGFIDEKSSIIPYNFQVLYVKPKKVFVLANWGTFLLKNVNNQQTELIIRTREIKSSDLSINIAQYIIVPLHFIMERRTLIGIKAYAEGNEDTQLSQGADIIWFAVIILSALLIYTIVFIGRGVTQSLIVPSVFSIYWLCSLLLFNSIPLYPIALLLVLCTNILILYSFKKTR